MAARVPTTHERIRDLLTQHRGRENCISSKEMANILGIERGPSSVNIRKLIRETIIQFRMPVAGDNRGYFIIQNNTEMLEYIHNIQSRMNEMTDRLGRISAYYFGGEVGPNQFDPDDHEPEL